MYDLIVIGAGPGGYEAAAHAGNMGKRVLLIEKNALGGTCLNVGCIPAKTLLRSAKIFSECKHADRYGVSTSSPEIDLEKVQQRKKKIVATLRKGVNSLLKKNAVEVLQGKAWIANEKRVEVDGKGFSTANILIATGSNPAVPPLPGIDSPSVLDSTQALEVSKIPDSMVIIGGGVIGLEFACFFSEIGTSVTVIEVLPDIGGTLDKDISKRLLMSMKKTGVTFHLSSKVSKIAGNTAFFKSANGNEQKVEGTHILNSTGREPVVEQLGLAKMHVKYDRKGISVSERGATNVPGIWACGDCVLGIQLAHVATRQGIVAVNNMFGMQDSMRSDTIPAVIYTHPEVAFVGKTEEQLKQDHIEYKKALLPMAIAGRFMIESEGQSGTIKVLVGKEHGEILGVHMIGDPSSEIIHSVVVLMESEITVSEMDKFVFPHPTVSEALREAILQAS